MKNKSNYVISTAVMAFVLFAAIIFPQRAQAVVLDRIVAVVGNDAITWVDLRRTMEDEFAQQLKGMDDEQRTKALDEAEADFLQNLVVRRLQVQAAYKLEINATDKDIEMAIGDIRSKYGLDPEAFRKVIEKEGLLWSRYRRMIGDQISMQRVVDREVRRNIPMPEVKEGASALYSVRLALFSASIGEVLAKSKAQEFMSELGSGKRFEVLQARYSDGPKGVLRIEESQLSSELKTALSGMAPGQVSEPFETERGIMVVELLKRETPVQIERERLFKNTYRRWVKELVENAYIDIRL